MSESKREIKRKPNRSLSEIEEINEILDQGYVAHVGFVDPDSGEVTVIPVGYVRHGDQLLFHGSTGSRFFMALKSGVRVCATVTLLDGLVAARSPFNSSMNYRSVMAFGVAASLDEEEKMEGLRIISERLIPGLWDAGREMTAKEIAQTMILSLPLNDVTAKKRAAGALDHEDASLPIWAGQIPFETKFGDPIPNEDAKHLPVPDHVKNLYSRDSSR